MRYTALIVFFFLALLTLAGCEQKTRTYQRTLFREATSLEEELTMLASQPCMARAFPIEETIADARTGTPQQIQAMLIGLPWSAAVLPCPEEGQEGELAIEIDIKGLVYGHYLSQASYLPTEKLTERRARRLAEAQTKAEEAYAAYGRSPGQQEVDDFGRALDELDEEVSLCQKSLAKSP